MRSFKVSKAPALPTWLGNRAASSKVALAQAVEEFKHPEADACSNPVCWPVRPGLRGGIRSRQTRVSRSNRGVSTFSIGGSGGSGKVPGRRRDPALLLGAGWEGGGEDVAVAVWWDFENCNVPLGIEVYKVGVNIVSGLRACGFKGPVSISAYGDTLQLSRSTQEALACTGIRLHHIPSGGKDSSDRALLVDLVLWTFEHPPPAHLFLISGDRDFSNVLHRLRMMNYNILLACPAGTVVSPALSGAATHVWQWNCLVRGEGLLLANPSPDFRPPNGSPGGADIIPRQSSPKPYSPISSSANGPPVDLGGRPTPPASSFPELRTKAVEEQSVSPNGVGKPASAPVPPLPVPLQGLKASDDKKVSPDEAKSLSPVSESLKRQVPKDVLQQFIHLLMSHPNGIMLADLQALIFSEKISFERDFYGHGKIVPFLSSMPDIVQLEKVLNKDNRTSTYRLTATLRTAQSKGKKLPVTADDVTSMKPPTKLQAEKPAGITPDPPSKRPKTAPKEAAEAALAEQSPLKEKQDKADLPDVSQLRIISPEQVDEKLLPVDCQVPAYQRIKEKLPAQHQSAVESGIAEPVPSPHASETQLSRSERATKEVFQMIGEWFPPRLSAGTSAAGENLSLRSEKDEKAPLPGLRSFVSTLMSMFRRLDGNKAMDSSNSGYSQEGKGLSLDKIEVKSRELKNRERKHRDLEIFPHEESIEKLKSSNLEFCDNSVKVDVSERQPLEGFHSYLFTFLSKFRRLEGDKAVDSNSGYFQQVNSSSVARTNDLFVDKKNVLSVDKTEVFEQKITVPPEEHFKELKSNDLVSDDSLKIKGGLGAAGISQERLMESVKESTHGGVGGSEERAKTKFDEVRRGEELGNGRKQAAAQPPSTVLIEQTEVEDLKQSWTTWLFGPTEAPSTRGRTITESSTLSSVCDLSDLNKVTWKELLSWPQKSMQTSAGSEAESKPNIRGRKVGALLQSSSSLATEELISDQIKGCERDVWEDLKGYLLSAEGTAISASAPNKYVALSALPPASSMSAVSSSKAALVNIIQKIGPRKVRRLDSSQISDFLDQLGQAEEGYNYQICTGQGVHSATGSDERKSVPAGMQTSVQEATRMEKLQNTQNLDKCIMSKEDVMQMQEEVTANTQKLVRSKVMDQISNTIQLSQNFSAEFASSKNDVANLKQAGEIRKIETKPVIIPGSVYDPSLGYPGSSSINETPASSHPSLREFQVWFLKTVKEAYKSSERIQKIGFDLSLVKPEFEKEFGVRLDPREYGFVKLQDLLTSISAIRLSRSKHNMCVVVNLHTDSEIPKDEQHRETKISVSKGGVWPQMYHDCKSLVHELMLENPDGLPGAKLKPLFLIRFQYPLDHKRVGYQRMSDLLRLMPDVVSVNGKLLVPSEELLFNAKNEVMGEEKMNDMSSLVKDNAITYDPSGSELDTNIEKISFEISESWVEKTSFESQESWGEIDTEGNGSISPQEDGPRQQDQLAFQSSISDEDLSTRADVPEHAMLSVETETSEKTAEYPEKVYISVQGEVPAVEEYQPEFFNKDRSDLSLRSGVSPVALNESQHLLGVPYVNAVEVEEGSSDGHLNIKPLFSTSEEEAKKSVATDGDRDGLEPPLAVSESLHLLGVSHVNVGKIEEGFADGQINLKPLFSTSEEEAKKSVATDGVLGGLEPPLAVSESLQLLGVSHVNGGKIEEGFADGQINLKPLFSTSEAEEATESAATDGAEEEESLVTEETRSETMHMSEDTPEVNSASVVLTGITTKSGREEHIKLVAGSVERLEPKILGSIDDCGVPSLYSSTSMDMRTAGTDNLLDHSQSKGSEDVNTTEQKNFNARIEHFPEEHVQGPAGENCASSHKSKTFEGLVGDKQLDSKLKASSSSDEEFSGEFLMTGDTVSSLGESLSSGESKKGCEGFVSDEPSDEELKAKILGHKECFEEPWTTGDYDHCSRESTKGNDYLGSANSLSATGDDLGTNVTTSLVKVPAEIETDNDKPHQEEESHTHCSTHQDVSSDDNEKATCKSLDEGLHSESSLDKPSRKSIWKRLFS